MKRTCKNFVLSMMVLGLIFGSASLTLAALVPINSVDGDWRNAVADPFYGTITIANDQDYVPGAPNDGRLATARWGTSTGSGQSGYDFVSVATPFNANSNGTVFALGDFTHQNYPITGTSLSSIQLLFNLGIDAISPLIGTFYFSHNETPNDSCSGPGGTGCPDRVTLVDPVLNSYFSYLGHDYYFSLLGFSQDGGNTISTLFITTEGLRNTATLYGVITEVPVTTPEPLTLILLGLGLVGVAGFRKRS